MDVIERCHRVLMKLVGSRNSVLVVAHTAVLQVIMGYFMDIAREDIPTIEVKMNTVYELEPTAYCTNTKECVLHCCCLLYSSTRSFIFSRNFPEIS